MNTKSHNKGKNFPPNPLTPDEAQRLIDCCGDSFAGRRTAAMVVLMYRSGLRCKETCNIDTHDLFVDGDAMRVRIMNPKGLGNGAMIREVGIDPKSVEYIERWRDVHPHQSVGPLFVTRNGTKVSTAYMRKAIPRAAQAAGIGRRVHCHGLRHTFARQWYEEGIGMVDIMHALGHNRLDTTQRYLQSIGCGRSVKINQGRTW